VPYAQKFDIVGFDKRDRFKVIQLLVVEFERAEMVYLTVDLGNHFLCENNVFVAAFENIRTVKVCMLMKHYHSHIDLIKIGIEQGNDNRAKSHHFIFLPKLNSTVYVIVWYIFIV
jgi:hypothetical protein